MGGSEKCRESQLVDEILNCGHFKYEAINLAKVDNAIYANGCSLSPIKIEVLDSSLTMIKEVPKGPHLGPTKRSTTIHFEDAGNMECGAEFYTPMIGLLGCSFQLLLFKNGCLLIETYRTAPMRESTPLRGKQ
uniref:Profilin n=1 Tax=Steinernema glaseri TaxID=37863 RepID=A0A1I8AKH0_9BILA